MCVVKVKQLTNKTQLWVQCASLRSGKSKLEWYMTRSFDWSVRKLHIARKEMFDLLYYTETNDYKKTVKTCISQYNEIVDTELYALGQ
mgnify:CR=1 FL=1